MGGEDARAPEPLTPQPDQPWVDWLVDSAWDYRAVVVIVPGYRGEPQAFLIPRRLN